MATPTRQDLSSLVGKASVDPRVYTDPDIFRLEMDRVWSRSWVFVAHESQIPEVGDFITTTVATRPVIVSRHKDGSVKVFYNRCAHKGVKLLKETCGNRRSHRCPYHGWVYDTDGAFVSRQQESDYAGTGMEKGCTALSIRNLPRVASYRGFVFASLAQDGPDLTDWLGGAASSFDNLIDRAPAGELKVEGGVLRYMHTCNWKMLLENISDNLHAPVAHRSAIQPAKELAAAVPEGESKPLELDMILPFGSSYRFFSDSGMTLLPHGHSYTGGTISIHSDYPEDPAYMAAMHAAHGKERTAEILSVNRHNTVVYPSVSIKVAVQTIRVYRPISVNRTIQETYTLRLGGAPDEIFRRSVLYNQMIFSPGSVAGHDDYECYERMMESASAEPDPTPVSMHRQYSETAEVPPPNGETRLSGTSEGVFRHEFRTWKDLMTREDV